MSSDGSFKVGDWLVEPDRNRISRGSEATSLRPQIMDLLVYLAERQGQVARTDDMLHDLWGGKVVADGTIYNCVAELRHVLDEGEAGKTGIETISKKGYRLRLPVSGLDDTQGGILQRRNNVRPIKGLPITVAGLLVVSIAGVLAWAILMNDGNSIAQRGSEPFQALENSVAVLPFEDLSADDDNNLLVDGFAATLIHQISQAKGLQVIARQSSFAFKGSNADVRDIGRALQVEAILGGSVQQADGMLRISAQLIDTRTGTHIWSKLFDRPARDIFAIQDEIAIAVASEISKSISAPAGTIGPEDRQRITRGRTAILEAYNALLLGDQRHSLVTIEGREQAETYYRRALELDPGYAMAWQRLADVLLSQWRNGNEPDELLFEARDAINRSMSLDDQDGRAWTTRAEIDLELLRVQKSGSNLADIQAMFKQALDLSPGDGQIHARYAVLLSWTSVDRLEVLEALRKAVALDPLSAGLHNRLGHELRKMQMFSESQSILARSRELQPDNPLGYWHAGETYRDAGDLADAIIWMAKGLRFEPNDAAGPFYIAYVAADLGIPELVEYWVGEGLKIDPNHEMADLGRLTSYQARGNQKAMLELAEQHASRGPPYEATVPIYRRILRNRDIDNGEPEVALDRYREQVPVLFHEEVPFEEVAYRGAAHLNDVLDVAYLLQVLGDHDRATYLLEGLLSVLSKRQENFPLDSRRKLRKVEILGMLGRLDEATELIKRTGVHDWPNNWSVVQRRRTLDPVRETPAFKNLVRRLEANVVAQRERYLQLKNDSDQH